MKQLYPQPESFSEVKKAELLTKHGKILDEFWDSIGLYEEMGYRNTSETIEALFDAQDRVVEYANWVTNRILKTLQYDEKQQGLDEEPIK